MMDDASTHPDHRPETETELVDRESEGRDLATCAKVVDHQRHAARVDGRTDRDAQGTDGGGEGYPTDSSAESGEIDKQMILEG